MNLKRLALIFPILLILLIVIPFLIPVSSYIPKIEQIASQKLGVPVKVGSLHIALLPSPRVNVGELAVGKDEDIKIANIAAVLDVTTLFSDVRVISTLKVDEPVVKQSAIALLADLPGKQGGSTGAAPVELRRIEVTHAILEVKAVPFPALNAEILLAAGGRLSRAHLTSAEGNLNVELEPQGVGYVALVHAEKWAMPLGPAIVFDSLTAKLVYENSTLKFPQVEARLYQGKLTSSGQLDWKKNWHLTGNFHTEQIEVGKVTPLFTKAVKVTGRITGQGTFSSVAAEPGKLADALALEYKFSVANGVLYGVDLVKAASLLIRQGQTGGQTQFDELSGTLHTRGKQAELRPVRVTSGLLTAGGNVMVMPDKQLSGKIDAELKKGVALVTVPLEISGTTEKPSVMPTKAALAGGAAGTVLMGPLGTNLGVKAGNALDKLFGSDK